MSAKLCAAHLNPVKRWCMSLHDIGLGGHQVKAKRSRRRLCIDLHIIWRQALLIAPVNSLVSTFRTPSE